VLQAAIGNGLSFDPFSFCQDDGAASEVDVGRGEVAIKSRRVRCGLISTKTCPCSRLPLNDPPARGHPRLYE
jgi:hypothetical protein